MKDQPKPRKEDRVNVDAASAATPAAGEWTPEWLANFGKADNWLESICDAHSDALAAEREKQYEMTLLGSKHCPAPENELGDSSGDVSGWDLIPVVKSNGELWLGLATIRHRNRQIATLNEQQAKGLLAAINAAIAAEREKKTTLVDALKALRGWTKYVRLPCGEYSLASLARAEAKADAALAKAEPRSTRVKEGK